MNTELLQENEIIDQVAEYWESLLLVQDWAVKLNCKMFESFLECRELFEQETLIELSGSFSICTQNAFIKFP